MQAVLSCPECRRLTDFRQEGCSHPDFLGDRGSFKTGSLAPLRRFGRYQEAWMWALPLWHGSLRSAGTRAGEPGVEGKVTSTCQESIPQPQWWGQQGYQPSGGMQQLTCRHRIFFPLGGKNYPHTSNISSYFHNQLTSALYHQASEKGVVTQLLKDGRDLLAGIHNKGRLVFRLEFLNRGRWSEILTNQKYFMLFWERFVLGL